MKLFKNEPIAAQGEKTMDNFYCLVGIGLAFLGVISTPVGWFYFLALLGGEEL